ncbi:MAG TPA: hypothetical protein VHK06_03720 [Candidatus Limnocylindria bacterium]|nr:hypothetical protein [Candidatus Limnocylindria bacterium]
MRISRLALAALLLAVLVGGVALGRAPIATQPDRAPASAPASSAAPSGIALPSGDVPGEEIGRLPRYPGSVRVAFDRDDAGDRSIASAEYLVRAPLDDVRSFYRGVFASGGWTVADMAFAYGEWTFLLVDDAGAEATVELEERSGVIEIDLRLTESAAPPERATPTTAATASPSPTAVPADPPPPVPQPPAPPPPPPPAPEPPDDDDGGDDDGEGDDD